jgi:hypothetical protein
MSQPAKEKDEILKRIEAFEDRLETLEKQRINLVFPYLTLRTIIGVLGMALPFVISLGAMAFFQTGLQNSISAYYHTGMRDVLVGMLWAIGFFLFSYEGYERADNIAGELACLFAIGVALFPTTPEGATGPVAIVIGVVHLVFAGLLFLTLSYFCIFLFTKTDPETPPTARKLQRNVIYRICGYTMLLSFLLIAVYTYLLPGDLVTSLAPYRPIFWLESLAIFAFGTSWFTKGEGILRDLP